MHCFVYIILRRREQLTLLSFFSQFKIEGKLDCPWDSQLVNAQGRERPFVQHIQKINMDVKRRFFFSFGQRKY